MIVAATSGWEIAIAFGTIGAAIMTSWLAFSTRGLAHAAAADTWANWLPVVVIESAGTAASGYFPKVELNYEGCGRDDAGQHREGPGCNGHGDDRGRR